MQLWVSDTGTNGAELHNLIEEEKQTVRHS